MAIFNNYVKLPEGRPNPHVLPVSPLIYSDLTSRLHDVNDENWIGVTIQKKCSGYWTLNYYKSIIHPDQWMPEMAVDQYLQILHIQSLDWPPTIPVFRGELQG